MSDTPRQYVCSIYLITDDLGFCKIGIASNPKARLKQLQCGNPRRLRIHRTWGFNSTQSAYEIEQHIHHRCVRHGMFGEWLRTSPDALERYTYAKIIHVKEMRQRGGRIARQTRAGSWQICLPGSRLAI